MRKTQYLNMTYEELIHDFFTDIINNPTEGLELIEEISKSKRYLEDYSFRTTVLTARGISYCLGGKLHEAIALLSTLVKTTTSLKLWELVSRNWNTLGICYMTLGRYEKAVECYHNVVKVEKKQGLLRVTASAYSNIGSIFLMNKLVDKACKYYELALETIQKGGSEQARYHSEIQLYYANLALAYSEKGYLDPIPNYLEKIKELGINHSGIRVRHVYYTIRMIYSFYLKDMEEVKKCYRLAKENISTNNVFQLFTLMLEFVEKCVKFGVLQELYEEELLKLEDLQNLHSNLRNLFVYKKLREYYRKKGNTTKLEELNKDYIAFLENEVDNTASHQAESIHSIDEIMSKEDEIEGMKSRHTELELVAEEAIRHKNSLQKAYDQIDLINQLGKRITSSIKLNEVIELIYHNVSKNIPVTIFILMVKNEEKRDVLDTIAFYDNGEIIPNVSLNLQKVKGFVAECFYNNKIISSYDEEYKEFFEKQRMSQKADVQSAIYLPLNVDDEIIGICSIQDVNADVYTDEKIAFLKELLPYLSIALNNAIRSRNLEKEIQSHLETQKELKEVNKRLEVLSSLDGLTQINGRRVFGTKLIQMIEKAQKKKTSLCIIMMDIDNFKSYNDNYGHLEGDEVLKKVATLFDRIVRGVGGVAARFGGEEFIASCLALNYEEGMKLAEKIRTAIYDLELLHEYSSFQRVTASIGVVISKNISMEQNNQFIKDADNCLYEAKKRGRNQVVGKEIGKA